MCILIQYETWSCLRKFRFLLNSAHKIGSCCSTVFLITFLILQRFGGCSAFMCRPPSYTGPVRLMEQEAGFGSAEEFAAAVRGEFDPETLDAELEREVRWRIITLFCVPASMRMHIYYMVLALASVHHSRFHSRFSRLHSYCSFFRTPCDSLGLERVAEFEREGRSHICTVAR